MNQSALHGVLVALAVAVLHALVPLVPALAGMLGPAAPFVAPVLSGLVAAALHYMGQDDPPKAGGV